MAKAKLQEVGLRLHDRVGRLDVGLDRSRVRILVCDPSTSPEVLDLLRRCSYQVMAVQSAREALDVLMTGASDVDLILAEVEHPMGKGLKMLKRITKHQRLKQIPIVMMSAHDEMAVVVKCLRLGAADYLVKPLRTNELLNLWTHMWRRRRMLALAEKHLMSGNVNVNDYPIQVLCSDTSESNTTSTDTCSEESNDKDIASKLDEANNACSDCNSPVWKLTVNPSVDGSKIEQETVKGAGLCAAVQEDQNCQLGAKRRRDNVEQLEGSDAKRTSRGLGEAARKSEVQHGGPSACSLLDSSRLKGVQFPFTVNDKVLIKGNRRTPERFVGREAIITSQCLNGWYLVRTLDSDENVRLQYRSLHKIGGSNSPATCEVVRCSDQGKDATGISEGVVEASLTKPLTIDTVEVVPLGSQHSVAEPNTFFNLEKESCSTPDDMVEQAANSMALTANDNLEVHDATVNLSEGDLGSSGKPASQDLVDEQLQSNLAQDPISLKLPSKADSETGTVKELRASLTSISLKDICCVGSQQREKGGFRDQKCVPVLPPRISRNSQLKGSTSGLGLQEADPYRKVYSSGSRRRGVKFGTQAPRSLEQSPPPLIDDKVVTTPNESPGVDGKADEILQLMRNDMLKLEKQIPWSYLVNTWRTHRNSWRSGVKASRTVQEVGVNVQDFRSSLLLTSAGGMPDDEWEVRFASIMESGDVELLVSLWGRLYDDVYKWLEARSMLFRRKCLQGSIFPLNEFLDLHRQIPALCEEGSMSLASITTAATLATADAVSKGQQDSETSVKTLLDSTMKLLRQQSLQDLTTVREALEREKRHVAAKLAYLDRSIVALHVIPCATNLEEESTGLTHPGNRNVEEDPFESLSAFFEIEVDADAPPVMSSKQGDETDEGDSDTAMLVLDGDAEATDLSDSD